jgi:hypothetical protein
MIRGRKLWLGLSVVAVASLIVFLRLPRKSEEVVASQGRSAFHVPTCKWARKINSNYQLNFSTPAEAYRVGLKPCKNCRHLMINLANPQETPGTPEWEEAWYRENPD